MKITAKTDVGCVYEDNQDFYVAGRLSDDSYWVVLCDGMGGVADGGRASRMAGEFFKTEIELRLLDLITPETIKGFMLDAVKRCNLKVHSEGATSEGAMMGTTVVMAIVRSNVVYVVHAGDSRAYHIQKRSIKQITRDHSIVQELLDAGKITPEQATNHPNKNIITSAVGIEDEIRIDVNEQKLSRGDMLLICSDGLSNMLSNDELLAIAKDNDFYKTADLMVERAVEAGGFDNITAVVLSV